jgi:uncharacterized repeat protein (TIGR04138 family)
MKGLKDLTRIAEQDGRYRLEAYIFVLKALDYTRKLLKKERHITGEELLEGIRKLAIHHYGLMAKAVLAHWGIQKTQDFGNIVFSMVNANILSKTDEDDIHDFEGVYDFNDAFVTSYTFHIREPYEY